MNHITWQNAFASTAFSAHGTIAVTLRVIANQQSIAWLKHGSTTSHITLHMNHSSRFMFKPPVSK
jgi:hypothetical protein